MKISIVVGSHRDPSQSAKVGRHIERTLGELGLCEQTWMLNMADFPLPLWEEKIWDGDPEWQARLGPISEQLAGSDAFVVVSPEWHGMVPSGLKNFFLMWGKGELAHKPALIVTVSAGAGGAYPVAELRMSSYKNNRICYIPEQVIVRQVESLLNEQGENDAASDPYIRERIAYALRILREYALALQAVRASGLTFDPRFKNGM
jgi:NAD(P)H-dependent FMN reductase